MINLVMTKGHSTHSNSYSEVEPTVHSLLCLVHGLWYDLSYSYLRPTVLSFPTEQRHRGCLVYTEADSLRDESHYHDLLMDWVHSTYCDTYSTLLCLLLIGTMVKHIYSKYCYII